MKAQRQHFSIGVPRRRATILLMVVSLLALLFVIIVGFLSLARQNRLAQEEVRKGETVERILESTHDLVRSQIRNQLASPVDGQLFSPRLGTDPARTPTYEDIPGYRGSSSLGHTDPVADPLLASNNVGALDPFLDGTVHGNTAYRQLARTVFPAIGSINRTATPVAVRLTDLLLQQAWAGDGNLADDGFDAVDIKRNAARPFMDADGDGVPDTLLSAMADLTDLANMMAGRPVRTPRRAYFPGGIPLLGIPANTGELFKPSRLPDPTDPTGQFNPLTTVEEQFRAFDENAKYEIASRTISHGSMIMLADERFTTPANAPQQSPMRAFSVMMFNSLRRTGAGGDTDFLALGDNAIFNSLAAQASAVEASLRNRGFLPNWGVPGPNGLSNRFTARIPSILRELESADAGADAGILSNSKSWPKTFDWGRGAGPSFGGGNATQSAQQINLGNLDTGKAADKGPVVWTGAVRANARNYNATGPVQSGDQIENYDRRHLLTTMNTSDDLARVQTLPSLLNNTSLNSDRLGLEPGRPKFYLGKLALAFDENGVFRNGAGGTDTLGVRIVRELASYYFDMLQGHDFGNPANGALPAWLDGVRGRQSQAWMLAVNTVAFAAPRRFVGLSASRVDNVRVTLFPGTANEVRYVGYAPQPVITQVGVYDEEPDPAIEDLVAYVELYNPNERTVGSAADRHALLLSDFAVSFTADDPNGTGTVEVRVPLETAANVTINGATGSPAGILQGRRFMAIAIGGTGTDFSSNATVTFNGNVINIKPALLTNRFQVKLWRRSLAVSPLDPSDEWYVVDELTITPSTSVISGATPSEWWAAGWRDCYSEPYFGPFSTLATPPRARWRTIVGTANQLLGNPVGLQQAEGTSAPNVGILGGVQQELTIASESPTVDGSVLAAHNGRFAPTIPLPLMNAMRQRFVERNRLTIHGASRPESFPTVGHMLFVSRFSHVRRGGESFPMSLRLAEYIEALGYTVTGGATNHPIDLGHMPLFDLESHPVEDGVIDGNLRYFDDEVADGIPWGQLVFDYFTTQRPNNWLKPYQGQIPTGQATALAPELDVDPATATWLDRDGYDPLRIPGRININTASWFVLSQLPVISPATYSLAGAEWVDFRNRASAAYWSTAGGLLFGTDLDDGSANLAGVVGLPRSYGELPVTAADNPALYDSGVGGLAPNSSKYGSPTLIAGVGGMPANVRLRPWLAQAAAAYRDGVRYLPAIDGTGSFGRVPGSFVSNAFLRNVAPAQLGGLTALEVDGDIPSATWARGTTSETRPYRAERYGRIRGRATGSAQGGLPTESGFLTIGELANVVGWDSSFPRSLEVGQPFPPTSHPLATIGDGTQPRHNDYLRAVSMLALLDTHFLTTRSNVFTIYTSVVDRENPQNSIRSQITVDRSNILPRWSWNDLDNDGIVDIGESATVQTESLPAIISRSEGSLLGAQYSD